MEEWTCGWMGIVVFPPRTTCDTQHQNLIRKWCGMRQVGCFFPTMLESDGVFDEVAASRETGIDDPDASLEPQLESEANPSMIARS
jgi:hypothetical protein